MVRPSRAAAVKDGPLLGPPGGLVLDGSEHGDTLTCVGISRCLLTPLLKVLRGKISDRGVAAAPIVEPLDEVEDCASRLGLGLEAVPREKLAFEGGEEALAHGVVIGVADRAHRGTHACLTAELAELEVYWADSG